MLIDSKTVRMLRSCTVKSLAALVESDRHSDVAYNTSSWIVMISAVVRALRTNETIMLEKTGPKATRNGAF